MVSVLKIYSQLSCRRSQSGLRAAETKGYLTKTPHYCASSRFLMQGASTPLLLDLIRRSAQVMTPIEETFAVDSTGFRTTSYGAYFAEKHNEARGNIWLKAHICIGTRTNIVTAVRITSNNDADGKHLLPLVDATIEAGFDIKELLGDKAYTSFENYKGLRERGAQGYLPFKRSLVGKRLYADSAWRDAFALFIWQRDEFMAKYARRNNVESTIMAVKAKLGETIRSRHPVAQLNELLCKVLAYNLTVVVHEMFERNIEVAELLRDSPIAVS